MLVSARIVVVVVADNPWCVRLWPELYVLGTSRYVDPPAVRTAVRIIVSAVSEPGKWVSSRRFRDSFSLSVHELAF